MSSADKTKLNGIEDGADVTDYTDYRISNSQTENNVTTIANPQGGTFSGLTANMTGAIVITLPQSWTNTMMKFEVDVYNYVDSHSFKALVGGYNHITGPAWCNTSAQIIGNTGANNIVRFGHDGTKCCVVIGATDSVWQYPKIAVKNFEAGHSNSAIANWATGWNVSLETDLSGYTFTSTHTNTLVDAHKVLTLVGSDLEPAEAGAQVNPATTAGRFDNSTTTVLQAKAMWDHVNSGDHDDRYYTESEVDSALAGKENAFSKNSAFNKNFGSTTDTVCEGDDSRLSDSRE